MIQILNISTWFRAKIDAFNQALTTRNSHIIFHYFSLQTKAKILIKDFQKL